MVAAVAPVRWGIHASHHADEMMTVFPFLVPQSVVLAMKHNGSHLFLIWCEIYTMRALTRGRREGVRSAFMTGVLDALLEHGEPFDLNLAGTSAGALLAAA
ncbi:MAG: hypothetical protein CM15mP128_3440 [Methanobacteriota archaeon]|nr:MAG: hypothetical protein CM15mP128_3440 [Euryarchaeota archaeon]